MKHLKPFLESKELYYKKIDKDEFKYIVNHYKEDNFNDDEKNKLEIIRKNLHPWLLPIPTLFCNNNVACIRFGQKVEIYIYKLVDEWYVITVGSYNYKCDQFQGVEDWFSDMYN